jgi:hypothetical protein
VRDTEFSHEPTEEDLAAIVAILLDEEAKTIQSSPIVSPWVAAARREAVEKWEQPARLSRQEWRITQ